MCSWCGTHSVGLTGWDSQGNDVFLVWGSQGNDVFLVWDSQGNDVFLV